MRIALTLAAAALATVAVTAKADSLNVFSTGVGTVGSTDSHYTLTSEPSGSNSSTATVSTANGAWFQPFSGTHWINDTGSGNANDPAGYFDYMTTFVIGPALNPASASLSFGVAMDDGGSVYLNNQYVGSVSGFSSLADFDLTSGFKTGVNTLTFDSLNNGGPAGLYVDVTSSSVTPEPSSFLLLGTGMLSTLAMARRRFLRS